MARTPMPADDASPITVTVKPRWWDDDGEQTFTLRPHRYATGREWEVYLSDGAWIGTVTRYTGSLDRHLAGTRLRSPGKQRTLWGWRDTTDHGRTVHGEVSRADCIRHLVDRHAV